jgi:hypothetical protein
MVVSLSALHADHPLPPGKFLVLVSVRGRVDPRILVQLEGLGQLKKKIYTDVIGNRTHDLLACSIVPQPTPPPPPQSVSADFKSVSCIEERISSISVVNFWTAYLIRFWRSGKSWMFLWCTSDFMKPQTKKSDGVKLGERATQGLSFPHPIHQFGKQLLRYSWTFWI